QCPGYDHRAGHPRARHRCLCLTGRDHERRLDAIRPWPKGSASAECLVSWFQTLRLALRALFRNKTRSFLTALGIIIGVAAVIAMMAIGEGAKKLIEDQFAAMGTNLLIITSGSTTTGGARGGSGSSPSLTWDD